MLWTYLIHQKLITRHCILAPASNTSFKTSGEQRLNICLRYHTDSEILLSCRIFKHAFALSLSAFDWLYILWGGDHSFILLLKEYYITVQRKWIRTGKKKLKERIWFSNKVIQTELQDEKNLSSVFYQLTNMDPLLSTTGAKFHFASLTSQTFDWHLKGDLFNSIITTKSLSDLTPIPFYDVEIKTVNFTYCTLTVILQYNA